RGNPNTPLILAEYSDYLCPFCARHFGQTLPALLERYGRNGQVQFVFHDFPLASLQPKAPQGHAAALCVGEQGADGAYYGNPSAKPVMVEFSGFQCPACQRHVLTT